MNLREWALPLYTILTQLAIGALFSLWIIRSVSSSKYGKEKMDQFTFVPVLIIFSTMILAIIGSHFHLSKPYLSFLAVRNFRYSWLSREVVFTILLFFLTSALVVLLKFTKRYHRLKLGVGWGAILVGFAVIYSMASIYLLPTQVSWNSAITIISYYAVMLLLGTTSLIVILLMDLGFSDRTTPQDLDFRLQIIKKAIIWLTLTASIAAVVVIALGIYQIELLRKLEIPSAQASLELILGIYQPLFVMRLGFTGFGVIWLIGVINYFTRTQRSFMKLLGPVYFACTLILIGEILERFLFYATHVRTGI